jgi:hypothetical protein
MICSPAQSLKEDRMRDIPESEWILSGASPLRLEEALENDRCPECGSGNWVVNQDDPVYCLVKQCNDCAEIWPYEQVWHTCVDEVLPDFQPMVVSRFREMGSSGPLSIEQLAIASNRPAEAA